jgi:hypothetical protein
MAESSSCAASNQLKSEVFGEVGDQWNVVPLQHPADEFNEE